MREGNRPAVATCSPRGGARVPPRPRPAPGRHPRLDVRAFLPSLDSFVPRRVVSPAGFCYSPGLTSTASVSRTAPIAPRPTDSDMTESTDTPAAAAPEKTPTENGTTETPPEETPEKATEEKEKETPPPKEMRAVVLTGFGGLKTVKILKKPEPTVGEGEVLIRVKAW